MLPQMKAVVTPYQPDVFWTDGEWDYTSDRWKSEQFLAWLYNESPVRQTVAVNDLWGKETRSKRGADFTLPNNMMHGGKEAMSGHNVQEFTS